jgi:tetratricopeptide (TPR) repeat protein
MHRSRMVCVLAACVGLLAALPALADDRTTCQRASGDDAIAACTRAIAAGAFAGTDLAELHTNRGVELKRKGDLDGAIKDYDIAIGLNPTDLFAFNNRANAWRDKGDLDRAIADYGAAIKVDADYAAAYINRGLVYERKKEFALARADFKAALAASPQKYNNSRGAHQMARQRLAELAKLAPE